MAAGFQISAEPQFFAPCCGLQLTEGEFILALLSAVELVLEIIWVRPGKVIAFSAH